MLFDLSSNFSDYFNLAKDQLPFMGWLLLFLWIFNLINWLLLGSRLDQLGIYPRSASGLIGIIFSPLLHANFNHLFFNSIPLFVLGMFILAFGQQIFIAVTLLIALLEGIAVWLFGRKYLHIGASGVISGYFGFILGLAYFQPTVISLVLAVVAVYYFGSIIAGVIPTSEAISWECHLAGLASGLLVMYLFTFVPAFTLIKF